MLENVEFCHEDVEKCLMVVMVLWLYVCYLKFTTPPFFVMCMTMCVNAQLQTPPNAKVPLDMHEKRYKNAM